MTERVDEIQTTPQVRPMSPRRPEQRAAPKNGPAKTPTSPPRRKLRLPAVRHG